MYARPDSLSSISSKMATCTNHRDRGITDDTADNIGHAAAIKRQAVASCLLIHLPMKVRKIGVLQRLVHSDAVFRVKHQLVKPKKRVGGNLDEGSLKNYYAR